MTSNEYRADHGAPRFYLDDTLNSEAQTYAETLMGLGSLQHDGTTADGENLYMKNLPPVVDGDSAPILEKGAATDAWYSEVILYDYNSPPADGDAFSSGNYGHFTALVWVSALRVGFGYAVKDNGENVDLYVVARYSSAPNVIGAFATNVLPVGSVNPGGWQAGGNMSDYMTQIWGFIDAAIDDDLDETAIAKNISDSCNTEWDTFWNVGVFWLKDATNNAVIYGYAFHQHWFWINDYRENRQSFLIWKDYNCVTPLELNDGSPSVESGDGASWFGPMLVTNVGLASDVWGWGKTIVEAFIAHVAG